MFEENIKDKIKELLENASFVFAKTMPNNPHWYTLKKTWVNRFEFEEVAQYIRDNGYVEVFKGKKYIMFAFNGFKYWTMGNPITETSTILINKAKL